MRGTASVRKLSDTYLLKQTRDNSVIIRHKSKYFNGALLEAISTNFRGVRLELYDFKKKDKVTIETF